MPRPGAPSRRDFLRTSLGGLAAGACSLALPGCRALSSVTATGRRRPPNFVIIFTDDQGYGDLGCYGATGFTTPNIDRMAAQGVRLTDFYVAPVCTPSRAALLTGCYPKRLGLDLRVVFPYMHTGLNPDEITLAEILRRQGYATGIVGKWHLGHTPELMPPRQGFDYFYGTPYSNDMGSHFYRAQNFKAPPLPIYRQDEIVEENPPQASLTSRYTREAVRYIEEHRDESFFLYLAHNMPHNPIDASARFKGTTEKGLYGDVISEIDWSTGQVLDALERLGLEDDTVVLFTSDNGPGPRDASAGPLRGRKGSTWEGGVRAPCIVRWPGRIPAGSVCTEMVSSMDVMPTFARFAGAEPPRDRVIDGRDVSALLFGKPGAKTPHKAFFYYRNNQLQAVRSGDWKLHLERPDGKGATQPRRLYNLREDIGESRDVAASHPDVVSRLEALAEKAREDMGDALTGRAGRHCRPAGEGDSSVIRSAPLE